MAAIKMPSSQQTTTPPASQAPAGNLTPYQEFMWRQGMRMMNNGATPAQIADYIERAEGNNLRAIIMPTREATSDYPGIMRGVAQQVLRGVTFGFADEAFGTLASLVPGGFSGPEARDQMRAEMRAFEQQHGKTALGAQILGGFAIPGAAALQSAQGLKAAAGVGAVTGALTGLGETEGSVAERLPGAGAGAAVGAVAAPVLGAVAKHLPAAVATRVPETFRARMKGLIENLPGSPSRVGLSAVAEAMDADGLVPEVVARRIDARTRMGLSSTLADVGGDHMAALANVAQDFSTPEQQMFARQLVTEGVDTGNRLLNQLGRGTRLGLQNVDELRNTMLAMRAARSEPLYDAVRGRTVSVDTELKTFLANPLWREVYEEGRRAFNEETAAGIAKGLPIPPLGDDIAPDVLPVNALDYMKQGLDAVTERLGANGRPMPGRRARALRAQLGIMLEKLDTQVPEYGAARRMWQGYSQALDEMQDGMEEFLTASPAQIQQRLISSPEPDFYRVGAISAIENSVHGASATAKDAERFFGANLFGGQDRTQLQRILALFDDPQQARDFADRVAGEAAVVSPRARLAGPRTPNPNAATERLLPVGRTRRVAERVGIASPREDRARLVANEITRLYGLGLDNPYALSAAIRSIPRFRLTSNIATTATQSAAAAGVARATVASEASQAP